MTIDPIISTGSGYISASDAVSNNYFGGAISISGDTMAVGAAWQYTSGEAGVGAVYLFERDPSGVWIEGEIIKGGEGGNNGGK